MFAALALAASMAAPGAPVACYDVAAIARIEHADVVGGIPAAEGEITLGTVDDLSFVIEKVLAGRIGRRVQVRSPLTDLFTPQARLLIFLQRKPAVGYDLIGLRSARKAPRISSDDPPACG